MLTPKCRLRDFRLRAPNSPKKCLCRLKPDLRGRTQAGIRAKFDGRARDRKLFYINNLFWLCWEATANASPLSEFPDPREKYREFPSKGRSPTCRNPLKHETFLGEFPAIGTGNFLVGNREKTSGDQRISACSCEADEA